MPLSVEWPDRAQLQMQDWGVPWREVWPCEVAEMDEAREVLLCPNCALPLPRSARKCAKLRAFTHRLARVRPGFFLASPRVRARNMLARHTRGRRAHGQDHR